MSSVLIVANYNQAMTIDCGGHTFVLENSVIDLIFSSMRMKLLLGLERESYHLSRQMIWS